MSRCSGRKRARGFTLVEVMVVVVVVAILASIALPSYSRYGFRARRADAHNMLVHLAAAQERYYSTHNRYSGDMTDFGYSAGATTEHGYYVVSLEVGGNGQSFIATATPQGPQASDQCGVLGLDNTGKKEWAGTESNGKCW